MGAWAGGQGPGEEAWGPRPVGRDFNAASGFWVWFLFTSRVSHVLVAGLISDSFPRLLGWGLGGVSCHLQNTYDVRKHE